MHKLTMFAMHHGALQKPDELDEFWLLIDEVQPKRVIEIGCDAGGMLAAWTILAPDVLGIDLPNGPWGSSRPLVTHGATVILGNSHDENTYLMAQAWENEKGVDVLFIDGDHTYEGVKQDYQWYSNLVNPGGLIVLQDIVKHDAKMHPLVNVHDFWNELKKGKNYTEIISEDGQPWAGIGVIRR